MIRRLTFTIFISLIFSILSFSQCREYIKAIAPSQLQPYVIDGNFFAPIVYEGDKVTLHRTFLAGHRYKIMVMGMDIWQKYITIKEQNGLVLFQNYLPRHKKHLDCAFRDYMGNIIPCLGTNYFEFTPDHSMNVEITVKIERKAKRRKDRVRGCLGIVVGFLPSDYQVTQQQDTLEQTQ